MACYHPIPASQDKLGARVVMYPVDSVKHPGIVNLELPCGTCLGCLSGRALEWANRCAHEASLWTYNSFLTLTYADASLPWDSGLEPWELCKFIKRLRKYASTEKNIILRDSTANIRYLAAGEYGERFLRPHYHLILFNCGFDDAQFCGRSNGGDLFESDTLSRLWDFGSHKLGMVTGASANYVAQYSMKKYGSIPSGNLEPPFIRMSLKPAIGAGWVEKYGNDLKGGFMVVNGHKLKIPRSYYRYLDPPFAEQVKYEAARGRCKTEDDKPERRADAEIIHEKKLGSARSSRRTF